MSSHLVLVLSLAGWWLTGCGPATPEVEPEGQPSPGKLTVAVGTGRQGFDGDGHAPGQSWLNQPTEVGFDAQGSLYIVDWNNHRLRQLLDGALQTVVGSKLPGDWPPDVAADAELDGSELSLNHPMDITFGDDGQAYLAAWHNHKVLALQPSTQVVRRIAGGDRPGYAGDGGDGLVALLNFPESLAVDAAGALLVADQRNNVIRRIAPDESRTVSTLVGVKGPSSYSGEGELGSAAGLGLCPYDEAGGADNPPPGGAIALDDEGNLYLADTFNHCIRRIRAGSDGLIGSGPPEQEIIETIAGECGTAGFRPELEPQALLLRTPRDIEIRGGQLYIADSGNHVIWRVELETGLATRLVGTGQAGDAPDSAEPLSAPLRQPYGLAFDTAGNLFIADTLNNRIRVLWK